VQNYGLDASGVEKRQLEGKLWEVILHGCKKESRKAKKGDLAVARQRMKQVLDEEQWLKKGKEV
jgi:hypothetical protein